MLHKPFSACIRSVQPDTQLGLASIYILTALRRISLAPDPTCTCVMQSYTLRNILSNFSSRILGTSRSKSALEIEKVNDKLIFTPMPVVLTNIGIGKGLNLSFSYKYLLSKAQE